jgi:protein involved in polysaccharide export with SLBB domain
MMSCNLLLRFVVFFLITTCFVSAQTQTEEKSATQATQTQVSDTKLIDVPKEELIHFGDLIDVDVVGSTEYDWRGTITPEGFLQSSFYNADPVYALCKSEEYIAQEIAKIYGRLLRNPQVVVKVIDRSNRSLSYIYGAVKTPQRLKIQRVVRLNEIIVLSGGITEKASGFITILRPPKMDCDENSSNETVFLKLSVKDLISGKTESNPAIKLGDVITIEESEPIYVIGGVNNPKQFLYREDLTLSRLISMSGGFSKDADPKNIIIYRRSENETKLINIDFDKIKLRQFEDIELEKYDIIEIGQNGRNKNRPNPKINLPEKGERTANLPLKIID